MSDVARKLVSCPEWRWLAGMLVLTPEQSWRMMREGIGCWAVPGGWYMPGPPPAGAIPDLSDWATVGCLLGMLPPGWSMIPEEDDERVVGWTIRVPLRWGSKEIGRGETLGEAVARALIAVWS